MRADILLFEKGFCKSRSTAKQLITERKVYADGILVDKPSKDIGSDQIIEIRGDLPEFVSRGGNKLKYALENFGINTEGKICADIGASTGGFTDCLLQYGAKKVYAVEGGRDQLDPKLRADSRVKSIEGLNARELKFDDIGELCDVVVMDVSFISQTLIHPVLPKILKENAVFITLIKPQFEVGRSGIGKNGIAKPEMHQFAIDRVKESCLRCGFVFTDITASPIKGGDGNVEYLAHFIYNKESSK